MVNILTSNPFGQKIDTDEISDKAVTSSKISLGGFSTDRYVPALIDLQDPDTNLLLNATVTPSGETNAVDGNLDTSTSEFSTTSTTEVELLRVDAGEVISAHLSCKFSFKTSSSTSNAVAYVEISEDGTSWTRLYGPGTSSTSHVTHEVMFGKRSFRYVRFLLKTVYSGYTAYLKVYEVFAI